MPITVTNQKPAELESLWLSPIAKDSDFYEDVKKNVISKLFDPLTPGTPAVIMDNATQLDADAINSNLFKCFGDNIDANAENWMKDLFSQTLAAYDPALPIRDAYAVQAGKKNKMLLPSSRVIYTPVDVIDASKQFLAGMVNSESFFATLAFYARVDSLGYYFVNEQAWEDFKAWFANEISMISSLISQETALMCNNLQKLKLDHLTESVIIRDNTDQNNEAYSFAKILQFYLNMFVTQHKQNNAQSPYVGLMPFTMSETICPKTIILVNVEKHARALPDQIKNEWDIIKASLSLKPKVLANGQIARLTAAQRLAATIAGAAGNRKTSQTMRAAIIKFRKTPPTQVDIYKYISRIYNKVAFVQNSENAVKAKKMTYQRPSRRHPDDPDKMGIATRIKYKPDLHIYLDCSGSISEPMYQDAIKMFIKLAKKMKVNFYFTSFSHIMSQPTKLHIQGHTAKQVYDEFKNIPKVSGGTDYEQIWHRINSDKKLQKQLSVIVTDFEYCPPNHFVKHPRFLYYAPMSVSNWKRLTLDAETFTKSMLGMLPDIRKHILM